VEKREQAATRILGAFTEALDALGADKKLVGALTKVRTEVIPELEGLVKDVDRAVDRAGGIKEALRGMREEVIDAEIVEEPEG
jgi:hypothetical protein